MSKKTMSTRKLRAKTKFQVKKLAASRVAVVVLEELSREYPDVCNFAEAVHLARGGNLYLALLSVMDLQAPLLSSAETSARAYWAHAQAVSVLKKCVDRKSVV